MDLCPWKFQNGWKIGVSKLWKEFSNPKNERKCGLHAQTQLEALVAAREGLVESTAMITSAIKRLQEEESASDGLPHKKPRS